MDPSASVASGFAPSNGSAPPCDFASIASLPPNASFDYLFPVQEPPSSACSVPVLVVSQTAKKVGFSILPKDAPTVEANEQRACFKEIGSQGEDVVVVKSGRRKYALKECPQGIDEEKFLDWGKRIIEWYEKAYFVS